MYLYMSMCVCVWRACACLQCYVYRFCREWGMNHRPSCTMGHSRVLSWPLSVYCLCALSESLYSGSLYLRGAGTPPSLLVHALSPPSSLTEQQSITSWGGRMSRAPASHSGQSRNPKVVGLPSGPHSFQTLVGSKQ